MACLFCGIVAREVPATIVHEDDSALAFNDIAPQAPFHVLVIPKKHVESLARADDATSSHVLSVCRKVAAGAGHSDYRVVTNIGRGAGQSVDHLHFHVLAGRRFSWPPG